MYLKKIRILDDLMNSFLLLNGATITFGPKHPISPRKELEKLCVDFFKSLPYLTDDGYKYFIERFGGAVIDTDLDSHNPNYIFVSIYEIEGPLTDGFTPDLDESGFFTFAEICYRFRMDQDKNDDDGLATYSYAFDGTGHRDKGVYKAVYCGTEKTMSYQLAYPDFLSFLQDLVHKKGYVLELSNIGKPI